MKNILILACSASKLTYKAPLVHLYRGPLWQIVRKRLPGVDLYALSAKYGLQPAHLSFEPYDLTLPKKGTDWNLVNQISRSIVLNGIHAGNLYFCGPKKYYEYLKMGSSSASVCRLPPAPRGNGDFSKALVEFCEENKGFTTVPKWHTIKLGVSVE